MLLLLMLLLLVEVLFPSERRPAVLGSYFLPFDYRTRVVVVAVAVVGGGVDVVVVESGFVVVVVVVADKSNVAVVGIDVVFDIVRQLPVCVLLLYLQLL